MGGTYLSARLPVRAPPATGRFHQKSTVGDRFQGEIDRRRSIEQEKGRKKKRKKKKRREKIPIARAWSSLVRRRRSRAVAGRQRLRTARGSRALFLQRGEKDRGD
ncbi:hypothetical protein BHE74_00049811, partial [Ensete ventricosum]